MLRNYRNLFYFSRRWKHGRDHWSVKRKKIFPKDRAMENFDDFYESVFGKRWIGIRAALLSKNKYVALVNNFGDSEAIIEGFELQGAMNLRAISQVARRRMEENNRAIFSDSHVYKLDERLGGFIRKQQEQEILSIYPQSSNSEGEIPSNIQLGETKPEKQSNGNETSYVDYRKSLHDVSRDDSEIDQQRIVDPEFGTGALYEYIPTSRIKGMEDWIPESDHYKYYSDKTDFPLTVELEKEFIYPEHLKIFTYEKGNNSEFISPKKCSTEVLSHYLMDGASILPPLFLDIQKGDKVLDACAAPGGKSLIMLQTMHPGILICNDIQESRVNRIKRVMNQYLYDYEEKWHRQRCLITQSDARQLTDFDLYDRILVDVPCTNDRLSVNEDDNNIFKPTRLKERLRIPELQSAILANCLKLLKPGGSLVYSTCSLSPIQNDGVVHLGLQKAFNEHGITAIIKDLSIVIEMFADIFQFENPKRLKYGQMVIPNTSANYGPMYFSKITRNL